MIIEFNFNNVVQQLNNLIATNYDKVDVFLPKSSPFVNLFRNQELFLSQIYGICSPYKEYVGVFCDYSDLSLNIVFWNTKDKHKYDVIQQKLYIRELPEPANWGKIILGEIEKYIMTQNRKQSADN